MVSTMKKGPLNLYLAWKSLQKGSLEKRKFDETKKILSERTVTAFASQFYDVGIPFNCVNYKTFDKFIEVVGQHGLGMNPSSYHDVRVSHLKKKWRRYTRLLGNIMYSGRSLEMFHLWWTNGQHKMEPFVSSSTMTNPPHFLQCIWRYLMIKHSMRSKGFNRDTCEGVCPFFLPVSGYHNLRVRCFPLQKCPCFRL